MDFFDYESCTNCEYKLYMRPRARLSRRPENLIAYLPSAASKMVQRDNHDRPGR
jgi:hypothetical protein